MKKQGLKLLSLFLSTSMLLAGCGTGEKQTTEAGNHSMKASAVTQVESITTESFATDQQEELVTVKDFQAEKNSGTVSGVSSEEMTITEENAPTSNDSIVQMSSSYQNGGSTGNNSSSSYDYFASAYNSSKVPGIVNSIITSGMSELEKAKAIHDWMVMNIDYDYQNYLNDTIPTSSWHVDGVLTTNYAICEGYARTFIALCEEAGLESAYVMGDTYGGLHAWNQVRIDGVWYNVDVCWDDPANRSFSDHSACSYEYFLISDAQMQADHSPYNVPHTCSSSLRDQVEQMTCPWRDYGYIATMDQFNATVESYVNSNVSEMYFEIDPNVVSPNNMGTEIKNAIAKMSVTDDYQYLGGSYTKDNWGIVHFTAKFQLNNGTFTKYTLATTEGELKSQIESLTVSSGQTQYVYLTTDLLNQTSYLNSNSIQKWLYFDKGLVMSCYTFSPMCDGIYKAHVSTLRPVTAEDSFIENAYSYADVEAIVADRLARGMSSFTIRYFYDTSAMTLEESYSHLINEQSALWATNYGMSVNVSSQSTDTCFVIFGPAQ